MVVSKTPIQNSCSATHVTGFKSQKPEVHCHCAGHPKLTSPIIWSHYYLVADIGTVEGIPLTNLLPLNDSKM